MISLPDQREPHSLGGGVFTNGMSLWKTEVYTKTDPPSPPFLEDGSILLCPVTIVVGAIYVCDVCGKTWQGIAKNGRYTNPADRTLKRIRPLQKKKWYNVR